MDIIKKPIIKILISCVLFLSIFSLFCQTSGAEDLYPPTVSISLNKDKVFSGQSIEVTVKAADDKDLAALWWWGCQTSDPDLDKAHWHSCSGTSAVHSWNLDTSNLDPGSYKLGANSRDAAYPVPGEPHQASEGEGIDYVSFTVMKRKPDLVIKDFVITPSSPTAGINDNVDMEISYSCEGDRDLYIDENKNGTYDPGTDTWQGHVSAEDILSAEIKINGNLFRRVGLIYTPVPSGTGWRIKFGETDGAKRFTADLYRACEKGINEVEVKIDSDEDIDESNEFNNTLTKTFYFDDIIPPDIDITNPCASNTIKNIVCITAQANDNIAVEKVEFFINDSKSPLYTDYKPPYKYEWETHNVENGIHKIKAVAYDTYSNSSKKEIEVQVKNDRPQAWIKIPKQGKRIRGNAVTIMAEVSKYTDGVLFQFKKDSESEEWTDISSIDKKKPFSVYWNTSELENGKYLLRAIAYDRYGYSDTQPEIIYVYIDDVNWDIHEDGNSEVDPNTTHRKVEKFSKEKDETIATADGTQAIIPKGINIDAESLEISVHSPKNIPVKFPPKESSMKSIGVIREYKFSDGSRIFNKNITLVLPFPDEDEDGIVDGTNIKTETLKTYWYNEEKELWIPVQDKGKMASNTPGACSDSGYNTVKVNVDHFTIFGLFGTVSKQNLEDVIVYPNPYRPNSGLGHTCINFDGLTDEARVTIYTLSGKPVIKLTEHEINGKIQWDGLTPEDEKAASGIYFYTVSDKNNNTTTGRLAIIR